FKGAGRDCFRHTDSSLIERRRYSENQTPSRHACLGVREPPADEPVTRLPREGERLVRFVTACALPTHHTASYGRNSCPLSRARTDGRTPATRAQFGGVSPFPSVQAFSICLDDSTHSICTCGGSGQSATSHSLCCRTGHIRLRVARRSP